VGGVAVPPVNDRLPNAFPRPEEASAVKRIRDVVGRTVLVTAALAVGLSGCSALNPSITTEPYQAAEGTNADLPGSAVKLRNFVVVGATKGDPAEVLGAVSNDGTTQVEVSLQATLGETAQPTQTLITVGPNSSVQLGPDQQFEMTIPQLPVDPGATTELSAATATGGRVTLTVPVVRPEGEYASITPAPAGATEEPEPTASPTDDSPNASATEQPTAAPAPKSAEPTPSS
jgi:hypothetical protein